MFGGVTASWWAGKTNLDGGAKYEPALAPLPTLPPDVSKKEMFDHLQVRPHHNPDAVGDKRHRRTDLVAFNDGCAAAG